MSLALAKLSINIKDCARCGRDHVGLSVKPPANPRDEYGWWAFCPHTEEPIWLRIEEIDK